MSVASSDALQMADSFYKLDEQTFARLTRSIVCDEFAVDRILRGLRIARDLERDRVIRVRAKIVADQLHCIRCENRLPKFRAALFHGRSEQPRDRDAFANSSRHVAPSIQANPSAHCCLNPGRFASHASRRCSVHLPRENGVSAAFLICDIAVRPMPLKMHNSALLNCRYGNFAARKSKAAM